MGFANARIENVFVGIDDSDELCAVMTLKKQYGCYQLKLRLTNPANAQRLAKLMNYTDVKAVKDLNGKMIRIAESECCLRGFGHLIDDKFVPTFTEGFKEINESEFEELLEEN